MNEKELVQRILAGEQGAQTALYQENAKRLYPVCIHFLGYQDPDAEDIIQETFLIAFKRLDTFEHKSSLYTWLNHICVNLCYERLRKRKKMLATVESDLEKLTLPEAGLFENERASDERKKFRLELLEKITASMSEKCRQILELRDRQGESYINLARILKIQPGTVMSQLARCRKALKHLLANELKGIKIE